MAMKKSKKSKITRKEAIKKFGKYAAMTAVGTFIILNPKKSAASSPPGDPWDWQNIYCNNLKLHCFFNLLIVRYNKVVYIVLSFFFIVGNLKSQCLNTVTTSSNQGGYFDESDLNTYW